jgi:hypothetical protein
MQSHTDGTNIITTACAEAATLYTKGVALLLQSSPDARNQLRAAVKADSHLAVALAALAVDAHSHGRSSECDQAIAFSLARMHGTTRRERQHVEIVALVLRGDVDRALALRAAHLAEFPLDSLIAHLLEPLDRS